MSKIKALSMAAALLLSPMTTAVYAADSYTIDEQHAWIQFAISHAGWSNARGQFRAISGGIVFDHDDVTNSSVNVVIQADSIDTNLEARDEHLRSPDLLNVEEFPTIEFTSTSIEQTGDRTALITGDMTLVGTTKSVVLDVVWGAEFPLPWDAATIKTGFSATTSINGVDFGINKLVDFGLGPNIDIVMDIEAVKQ